MAINDVSDQYPAEGEPDTGLPPVDIETPNPQKSGSAPRQIFGVFASIQTIATYAILFATLFTLFSPDNLFSGQMLDRLFEAWQADPVIMAAGSTSVPSQDVNRIGIVSGHWKNDSGAVCADGLTEEQVNLTIASLVQQKLTAEGFKVDLLEEFDVRLSQYKAIALISIHADTCEYQNDNATGFKVAAALESAYPEKATRLTGCLIDRYSQTTGLPFIANTTIDMTSYHAFGEINTETTAAIIETGYLNLDRQTLTQHPDLVAEGIVKGLLCFIRNENVTPTQTPQTIQINP